MRGSIMTLRKSESNNADTDGDFLTLDGVAKYLSISRMSVYGLINDENRNFPKSFNVTKAKRRQTRLWDKSEVKFWLIQQRSENIT
jgi:predicted DNA-binding transcriptional regulator AlpA